MKKRERCSPYGRTSICKDPVAPRSRADITTYQQGEKTRAGENEKKWNSHYKRYTYLMTEFCLS